MGGWQTPPLDNALALPLPLEVFLWPFWLQSASTAFGFFPMDFLIHFLKVAGSIVPLALAEVVDVRLGGHHWRGQVRGSKSLLFSDCKREPYSVKSHEFWKDNKRLAVSLSYGSFAERLPRNLPSDCVSSACGTDYPQTSPSTVNIVPMFTVLRSMW